MNRFRLCAVAPGLALLLTILLSSCAPVNLYTISMKYLPQDTPPSSSVRGGTIPVTVATFIDARDIADTIRIGTVTDSDGREIPVTPKERWPAEAVTSGVRQCLAEEGYSLSPESPAWDLRSDSIDKLWGTVLLIGGSIDRLEIVCHKEGFKKTYRTDVKLTMVFGDARKGTILRRTEAAAASSLEHVSFSEEMLGEQISKTLSKAIRQVCADGETIRRILEQLKREGG